jgi:hypothetical protein
VAKATTHNDSAILTQTLKPQAKGRTYVVAEATTHKSCDFFRSLTLACADLQSAYSQEWLCYETIARHSESKDRL